MTYVTQSSFFQTLLILTRRWRIWSTQFFLSPRDWSRNHGYRCSWVGHPSRRPTSADLPSHALAHPWACSSTLWEGHERLGSYACQKPRTRVLTVSSAPIVES